MNIFEGEHLPDEDTFGYRWLREAQFAAQVPAELADKTASELHVVYVEVVPYFVKYSAGTTMGLDPKLYEKI